MFNNLKFKVMSDLANFFEEFLKQGFEGELVPPCALLFNSFQYRHSSVIASPVLNYVAKNCPSTLRYFVSFYTDDYGEEYCYLEVYEDQEFCYL